MRIELPIIEDAQRSQYEKELAQLAGCDQQHGAVCQPDCPLARTQPCTPSCSQAPLALSSDSAFPIEEGVLPLVFELKASRVFEPIWSCEGHYDTSHKLRRLPSVWFCCESLAHIRTLAEVITDLCFETKSSTAWRVSLCCPGFESPNTVFKLEPEVTADIRIENLHIDMSNLAQNLRDRLSKKGRMYIGQKTKIGF